MFHRDMWIGLAANVIFLTVFLSGAVAQSALTRVNPDNPFAKDVVQLAKDLQAQYREFQKDVAGLPATAGVVMDAMRTYYMTYRSYHEAVRNYRANEDGTRVFAGRVFGSALPSDSYYLDGTYWGPTTIALDSQDSPSQGGPMMLGEAMAPAAYPGVWTIPPGTTAPIEGAMISLLEVGASAPTVIDGVEVRSSGDYEYRTTDARGAFSFRGLEEGKSYEYSIEFSGYDTRSGKFTVKGKSLRGKFTLQPRMKGDINGRVAALLPEGLPLIAEVLEGAAGTDEASTERIQEALFGSGGVGKQMEELPAHLEEVQINGYSPISLEEVGQHVVRNRAEFRKLIREAGAKDQGDQEFAAPDFDRESLIVVSRAPRQVQDSWLSISRIVRTRKGERYTVHYTDQKTELVNRNEVSEGGQTMAVLVPRISSSAVVEFVREESEPIAQAELLAKVQVRVTLETPRDDGTTAPKGAGTVKTVTTDEMGNFYLPDLEAGSYRIDVQVQGHLPFSGRYELAPAGFASAPVYLIPTGLLAAPATIANAAEVEARGNDLDDPFEAE